MTGKTYWQIHLYNFGCVECKMSKQQNMSSFSQNIVLIARINQLQAKYWRETKMQRFGKFMLKCASAGCCEFASSPQWQHVFAFLFVFEFVFVFVFLQIYVKVCVC